MNARLSGETARDRTCKTVRSSHRPGVIRPGDPGEAAPDERSSRRGTGWFDISSPNDASPWRFVPAGDAADGEDHLPELVLAGAEARRTRQEVVLPHPVEAFTVILDKAGPGAVGDGLPEERFQFAEDP